MSFLSFLLVKPSSLDRIESFSKDVMMSGMKFSVLQNMTNFNFNLIFGAKDLARS